MPSVVMSDNFGDAWVTQLARIIHQGKPSGPRGFQTREILGSFIYVENGRENILVNEARDPNYKFMVAEWLWIALGQNNVETIARYNKKMLSFSDDGRVLYGAYGPRVVSQMDYIIGAITRDRETRQAVLTTWIPNPLRSKDVPCTVSMQFLVRNDKLHLIVTMRSSDIWLGLPYDFFTFSQIGNGIAGEVNTVLGSVTMLLGSSHLYDTDYEKAQHVFNTSVTTVESPQLSGWPIFELKAYLEGRGEGWEEDGLIWRHYAKAIAAQSKKGAFDVLQSLCTEFP